VVSKIGSHKREVSFVRSILPISEIRLETASFDTHKIDNPKVKGWRYQKGFQYGWSNVKLAVLDRDKHACRICKSGKVRLEVHHILEKKNGGTDVPTNLITLCSDCHSKIHSGELELGKRKATSVTRHATQTDTIVSQLLKWLKTLSIPFSATKGYITSVNRQFQNWEKEHHIDAVCIALQEKIDKRIREGGEKLKVTFTKLLHKKCVSKGDYKQTFGSHSEKRLITGKLYGFRTYDKILYKNSIYWIRGKMSTGYYTLMNIFGEIQKMKPMPKANTMVRLEARKCVLTSY
jgi:hypothetical protein